MTAKEDDTAVGASDPRRTIRILDEAHIAGGILMEPHTTIGDVEVFPNCRMGMHSYLVSGLLRSGVSIGRYCSIGRNVAIGTGEHAMDALSTGGPIALKYGKRKYKQADADGKVRTSIGHDVWIGDKATIFSGVTVGAGAVIGTGAVVTKDVEPYSIVIGMPARLHDYRFPAPIRERLLKSRWWNYDLESVMALDPSDIEQFLDRFENSGLQEVHSEPEYISIPPKSRNQRLLNRIAALEKRLAEILEP